MLGQQGYGLRCPSKVRGWKVWKKPWGRLLAQAQPLNLQFIIH
jgi:hypothetical protein